MSLTAEQQQKLKKQVEFYFSDVNIAKDVLSKMAESAEGFVPLTVLLTFNRINQVTKDAKELLEALRGSEALVVDEAQMAIRRSAPLPESIQTDNETVYVKPVPATATLEELQTFFGQFGSVRAVWRRYFAGNAKAAEKQPKSSVFVVFTDKAEAEKLLASPPKYGDDQLLVQWASEYHAQKAAEVAAKNKGKAAVKEAKEARPSTPSMPKDASYTITGCGDIEKFTAIKGLWQSEEQRGVRYVFTPSKDTAQVIFQDAQTAETMVKDLADRATTLNGVIPTVTKITGDDEAALLASVEKEIADRAAANPGGRGRGGRGGRGGFRGGRGGQKRSRD